MSSASRLFILIAATLVGTGLFATPALAQPTVAEVLPHLQGYEWSPRPDLVDRLGPDADLTLMTIAQDAQRHNFLRFRAIHLLRLYPSERVAAFLEQLPGAGREAGLTRRALESHAAAFSATQPERVERLASDLLDHGDPHVRIQAAKTLRTLNTPSAAALYRQRLQRVAPGSWEHAQWQE
ncbi:MAG: hypothetical protein HQL66_03605 [Magnetococcales bacterium]|nr:hypothetical protein [Magnetococcales bacterium]